MRHMRITRTLALGGIWTYLFAKKVLPFLQERFDLPLSSFKTWHAQKKAFLDGSWSIDSLDDLILFCIPIAVLISWFVGWILVCRINYKKLTGAFFKILGSVFKTAFHIKPKLVISRKGLVKPIRLLPQFTGIKKSGKDGPVTNSVQPSPSTTSPQQGTPEEGTKTSAPPEENDSAIKPANTHASPALQDITVIARAHGFRVFANLSMVEQKLPLSCAWRENAVLFNVIDSSSEDWVVEESADCTQAQWFSGTSYMSSPCLPLLRIKEALLQKNAGLKVFCVLVLASGSVVDEDAVAENLEEQGIYFVCLDDLDSNLTTLDDFFTQTFPNAGGHK